MLSRCRRDEGRAEEVVPEEPAAEEAVAEEPVAEEAVAEEPAAEEAVAEEPVAEEAVAGRTGHQRHWTVPLPERTDPVEETADQEARPELESKDEEVLYLPDADAWPGPPAASQTPVKPAPRAHKTKEPVDVHGADPKGNRLFVGGNRHGRFSVGAEGDLQKVNQRIGFDPGLAARVSASVMWLNALGGAHGAWVWSGCW